MRRTKKRALPGVDVVETRVLPSAAVPMAAPHALNAVVREVRTIMNTLGRTEDIARASVRLTNLSAKVPSGRAGLAPLWQADLVLYSPQTPGSVGMARRQMIGDLRRFVSGPPLSGNGPTGGSGSTPPPPPPWSQGGSGSTPPPPWSQGGSGPTAPVPTISLDSVNIRNTTGIPLTVTVYLQVPQIQKPWITLTIPARGSTTALFNFGSATGAFMTMDVSRADGGQTPPPLRGYNLPQPMNGYRGTLFTISVFGSYFNVGTV